jgi:hypothetical protein
MYGNGTTVYAAYSVLIHDVGGRINTVSIVHTLTGFYFIFISVNSQTENVIVWWHRSFIGVTYYVFFSHDYPFILVYSKEF